jgi:hypothetical protein
MSQVLSAWQAAILEALNLSDRIRERGARDLANSIVQADERRDKEALIEALEDVAETYEGDEEERIREIAAALVFKVDSPEHHNVDYLLDTAEWLPRVPFGLEPYGLALEEYEHKDGHKSRFWYIPGTPISEKYGAILLGYDYLSNQQGQPFIGMRFFFEKVAANQELTTMLDDDGEVMVVPLDDKEDINFYKCILAEKNVGSVEKTLNLIRNALLMEETLSLLEKAVEDKQTLTVFPNAEDIPTEL